MKPFIALPPVLEGTLEDGKTFQFYQAMPAHLMTLPFRDCSLTHSEEPGETQHYIDENVKEGVSHEHMFSLQMKRVFTDIASKIIICGDQEEERDALAWTLYHIAHHDAAGIVIEDVSIKRSRAFRIFGKPTIKVEVKAAGYYPSTN